MLLSQQARSSSGSSNRGGASYAPPKPSYAPPKPRPQSGGGYTGGAGMGGARVGGPGAGGAGAGGAGAGGAGAGGAGAGGENQSQANQSQASESTGVEKDALKSRVNQLERLLADACYCMTLAVGDQNPSISALMKTISEMAPESSLANQSEGSGAPAKSESE